MPVTLAHIAANTARATLDFGASGSLAIDYYPLLITDEMFVQLQSFASTSEAEAPGKLADLNRMLVEVIQQWDLLEDDGQTVIPLTVERLTRLSPVIKAMVLQAILGSISPEALAPQTMISAVNGAH